MPKTACLISSLFFKLGFHGIKLDSSTLKTLKPTSKSSTSVSLIILFPDHLIRSLPISAIVKSLLFSFKNLIAALAIFLLFPVLPFSVISSGY